MTVRASKYFALKRSFLVTKYHHEELHRNMQHVDNVYSKQPYKKHLLLHVFV